ncbi:MAG: hypothetical protein WEC84_01195 [Candidatus Andersenbacteria bacterium]
MNWLQISKILAAVAITGLFLFAGYSWLAQEIQRPTVTIDASYNVVDLGLPVYAQFITTQRLQLSPTRVSHLVIPIHNPTEQEHEFMVRLIKDDDVIEEWQAPSGQGLHEARFSLMEPTLLEGELDVQFDGGAFTHEQKETAPRIFVEKSAKSYPDGNYRIASNEKEGSIGLTVYEVVPQTTVFLEQLESEPSDTVIFLAALILLSFLLITAPFVLF